MESEKAGFSAVSGSYSRNDKDRFSVCLGLHMTVCSKSGEVPIRSTCDARYTSITADSRNEDHLSVGYVVLCK